MNWEPINVLLLLASANCFLLAVLIFHKHRRVYANRYLGALMLVYGVVLLYLLLQEARFFDEHPLPGVLMAGFPLVAGPLHYLYAGALIRSAPPTAHRWWLHGVPFLLYKLYLLPDYVGTGTLIDERVHEWAVREQTFHLVVLNTLLAVQAPLYMMASLRLIAFHARRVETAFSSTERVRLDWLRNITYLSLTAWLVFFVENLLVSAELTATHYNVSSALAAVYVYVLGYMGLVRSDVFEQPTVANTIRDLEELTPTRTVRSSSVKYERSGLTEEKAQEYGQKVVRVMETEHLYRDNELTLGQLAEHLGLSPHNLSEVINTQLHQTFFDLVNGYRVEEVKRALVDPEKQHLTVLAIALDAGFNSKASFNTLFKKHAGTTPSLFRAAYLQRTGRS